MIRRITNLKPRQGLLGRGQGAAVNTRGHDRITGLGGKVSTRSTAVAGRKWKIEKFSNWKNRVDQLNLLNCLLLPWQGLPSTI